MPFYKSHLFRFPVLLISFVSTYIVCWHVHFKSFELTHWAWQLGIAFFYTWMIMFCTFMLFQLYGKFRLPQGYYKFRSFETQNFFKYVGVRLFRLILVNSFFKKLNPRVYMRGRDKDYVYRFYFETKHSETSHILGLFVTTALCVLYWNLENYTLFTFLMIFNVIFNLYPMLLQRMNRSAVELRIGREDLLQREKEFFK